jgi:hypothetical protein
MLRTNAHPSSTPPTPTPHSPSNSHACTCACARTGAVVRPLPRATPRLRLMAWLLRLSGLCHVFLACRSSFCVRVPLATLPGFLHVCNVLGPVCASQMDTVLCATRCCAETSLPTTVAGRPRSTNYYPSNRLCRAAAFSPTGSCRKSPTRPFSSSFRASEECQVGAWIDIPTPST